MTQRTPRALRILAGNPSRRPLPDEVEISSLPLDAPPPAHLPQEARNLWSELLSSLPSGLLSIADKEVFSRYVELVALYRQLQNDLLENGRTERRYNAHGNLKGEFLRPQAGESLRVMKELRAIECQLGFSPVSRGRVETTAGSSGGADDISRLFMNPPSNRRQAAIDDVLLDRELFGE